VDCTHRLSVPIIDQERCTQCGLCAAVCPSEALALRDGKVQVEVGVFTGCIGCGQCMLVCPGGHVHVVGRRLQNVDVVPLPPPAARATADQLDTLLLARRSVRTFTDSPVGRDALERILAMTATAPVGIPPSEVGIVVFDDREKVRRLHADMVASFRRMRHFLHPALLWLTRPFRSRAEQAQLRDFVRPLMDLIVSRADAGEDALFYDAPAALLFHRGPASEPADVHIAATYAMLAAQSLGLGSCMIGSTVGLNHDPRLKAKLGIPRENEVGLGLILGHPAVAFHRGIRRPLASVKYAPAPEAPVAREGLTDP
jgi:nitroreductase/Pyruvate/2-oxoacid:ferredoxin oxidoreductase delta subunit